MSTTTVPSTPDPVPRRATADEIRRRDDRYERPHVSASGEDVFGAGRLGDLQVFWRYRRTENRPSGPRPGDVFLSLNAIGRIDQVSIDTGRHPHEVAADLERLAAQLRDEHPIEERP